jgi:hypothetical protein
MIRKTAAITAASIAGVIIAGGAAVGANIGILNAADDNSLGNLSADMPTTTTTVEVPASLPPTIDDISDSSDTAQSFAVDVAGTVEVQTSNGGLELGDVRTNQGWSWEETSSDNNAVIVIFTSGTDTLEFSATANADGTISASVDRPSIAPAQTPAATSSPSYRDDDEYDDDDDDRYEDDDDDYDYDEHDEHEGRDDDD